MGSQGEMPGLKNKRQGAIGAYPEAKEGRKYFSFNLQKKALENQGKSKKGKIFWGKYLTNHR
jgi:hypothetical protein